MLAYMNFGFQALLHDRDSLSISEIGARLHSLCGGSRYLQGVFLRHDS